MVHSSNKMHKRRNCCSLNGRKQEGKKETTGASNHADEISSKNGERVLSTLKRTERYQLQAPPISSVSRPSLLDEGGRSQWRRGWFIYTFKFEFRVSGWASQIRLPHPISITILKSYKRAIQAYLHLYLDFLLCNAISVGLTVDGNFNPCVLSVVRWIGRTSDSDPSILHFCGQDPERPRLKWCYGI